MVVVLKWVVFILSIACKQQDSVVLTLPTESARLLATGQAIFSSADAFFFRNADLLISYEEQLNAALDGRVVSTELLQMQYKLRSIIAYAVHSRCFVAPQMIAGLPLHMHEHQLEKNWRDRYDLNYYKRKYTVENLKKKSYEYATKQSGRRYEYRLQIDAQKLCAIFLAKLKEMTPAQIDLSQSNTRFFQKVMADKVAALSGSEMRVHVQQFFRQVLAPQVITTTEASMARTRLLFPFHGSDYVAACRARRDYYDVYRHKGYHHKKYRYPAEVRSKINCQELRQLPSIKIKAREKANCANPAAFTGKTTTTPTFADLNHLTATVKDVIKKLNTHRAILDKLVRNEGTTQKKPLLLPFLKVLNAIDLEDTQVIKAYDSYNCQLVEAAKAGTLPLIFANSMQKTTGSVHLNHMGRFFGFGKVTYKPLQLPTSEAIQRALHEAKRELVDNWLDLQAARLSAKDMEEQKIYATILNNEIAVTQLILQNPAHAVAVTHLLRKFQHKPITPKWLRVFKNGAMAADLAFIPIVILGGFVTGGVGIVPLLIMANAVNFLWIGAAAAETVVARNRYRLIERALLSGNSEQVERGMEILREFHERKRNLIVSGGVGATLSVVNLSLIAHGIDNLATVPIDISAAFASDIETFTVQKDELSDTDVHNRKLP